MPLVGVWKRPHFNFRENFGTEPSLSDGSGDRQSCHQQVSWQGQCWQGQIFLPENHVRGWGGTNKKHEVVVIPVSWLISQCNKPMFTCASYTAPLRVSLWWPGVTQGCAPFSLPLGIKGNQSWQTGPSWLRGIPSLQWLPGTGPGQIYMQL